MRTSTGTIESLIGVRGSGSGVFAIADNAMLRWDGVSWTRQLLPATGMTAIAASPDGDVWAGGTHGAVVQLDRARASADAHALPEPFSDPVVVAVSSLGPIGRCEIDLDEAPASLDAVSDPDLLRLVFPGYDPQKHANVDEAEGTDGIDRELRDCRGEIVKVPRGAELSTPPGVRRVELPGRGSGERSKRRARKRKRKRSATIRKRCG